MTTLELILFVAIGIYLLALSIYSIFLRAVIKHMLIVQKDQHEVIQKTLLSKLQNLDRLG